MSDPVAEVASYQRLRGLLHSHIVPILPKHFSFGIFLALLDVALRTYERYVEGKLLIEYWECRDTTWFWLTFGCIMLPAVIGAVLCTLVAITERDCGWHIWTAMFLVFPISSMLW